MRKYYVDYMCSSCKRHKHFFDTLQEAIDALKEAKSKAEDNKYLGMFGYGLVIDVPDSECEEGVTDDELIRSIDIPKCTNIECAEHKILSRYSF